MYKSQIILVMKVIANNEHLHTALLSALPLCQLVSTPLLYFLELQTDGIFGLFKTFNRINIWCGLQPVPCYFVKGEKWTKHRHWNCIYSVVWLQRKVTVFFLDFENAVFGHFKLCEQYRFTLIQVQIVAAAFISPDLECTWNNLLTPTNVLEINWNVNIVYANRNPLR